MDDRLLVSLCSGRRGSRIFGYRVFDLRLKHLLGLFYLESPYAVGGEVEDADVILAARMLSSQTEDEWQAALGGGGFWERVAGIFKGLRYGRYDRREREQKKLEAWLEVENLVPQVLSRAGGRKMRVHWLMHLVASVMRETGCSIEEAWWMRFSDVAWAKIAWDEQDGGEFVLLTDKKIQEFLELGWTLDDIIG